MSQDKSESPLSKPVELNNGGTGGSGGSSQTRGTPDDDNANTFYDVETIDVVRFNVPPYTGKLRTWFTRLEAQFRAGRVRSAAVKFNVVIAQAPEHLVEQLTDGEIESISQDRECYEKLKALMLRRFTPSEHERFNKIIRDMNVHSDDRPSELLRKILVEAKDILPDDAVQKLWLMKLPVVIQMLLVNDTALPLPDLAEKADQYFVKYQTKQGQVEAVQCNNPFLSTVPANVPVSPTVNSSVSPAVVEPWAALTKAVEKLTFEVSALKRVSRGRTPERQFSRGSRNRSATPAPSTDDRKLCWYHRKFGDRAADCRPPCNFQQAGNL